MSLMDPLAGRNSSCPLPHDSVWTERIPFRDEARGAVMLSQTLLGALGNFSLLCHYLSLYHRAGRMRAIDVILTHLTVSNSMLIVSQGAPQTMAAFGLKHLFSDLSCDFLLYVHRVGRCMSIGTTCLSSVFQAITISPMNSCWKDLKAKASHYVTTCISLCWILYMIVNLFFPMHTLYISSKWSLKNITRKRYWEYCDTVYIDGVGGPVYSALFVFPEVMFSVLIVWASGSMVSFLYRHKQRVQHLHRNNVSSRPSAESRATHRILILGSSFVCFHTLSSLINMYLALLNEKNEWLHTLRGISSLCFPTLSPFLVMRSDSTVFGLFSSLRLSRKSQENIPK